MCYHSKDVRYKAIHNYDYPSKYQSVLIMEQMGLLQNEKKEGCYDVGLEWKLHLGSINMYCDYDILL